MSSRPKSARRSESPTASYASRWASRIRTISSLTSSKRWVASSLDELFVSGFVAEVVEHVLDRSAHLLVELPDERARRLFAGCELPRNVDRSPDAIAEDRWDRDMRERADREPPGE